MDNGLNNNFSITFRSIYTESFLDKIKILYASLSCLFSAETYFLKVLVEPVYLNFLIEFSISINLISDKIHSLILSSYGFNIYLFLVAP